MYERRAAPPLQTPEDSSPAATAILASDVMRQIAGWADLLPTHRRDLTSAVSTICRWLGHPAGDVALSTALLRDKVLTRAASTFGVSAGRWKNIKSELRLIMTRLGMIDDANAPVSAVWEPLLGAIEPRRQPTLAALARFCDRAGIPPAGVDEAVMAAFELRLITHSLRPKPRKFVGEVRGLWNRAARESPSWPPALSGRRPNSRHFALPIGAFTAAFQADLAAFGRALAADPFDDFDAAAAGDDGSDAGLDDADSRPLPRTRMLKASTVANRMDHARWAASALVATGVSIAEIRTLKDLVLPAARPKAILKFLHHRADGISGDEHSGRSGTGQHVADVLRIIARHHVRLPESEVAKIIGWGNKVRLRYAGMTEKNERTVREAMTPERELILLSLPGSAMQTAQILLKRSKTSRPLGAASLAMRALAVEILTKLPIRLGNLLGLETHRHFRRANPRTGRVTAIFIPASETKTKRAISMPVSEETAALIEIWERDFRPHIAPLGNPYLFPNANSAEPMWPQGMRSAVKEITLQHVGVAISPHQFRHLAARRVLQALPGDYGLVQQILGHASVETTRKSYCSVEQAEAIERHDQLLNNKRLALGRGRRQGRGGRR